MAECWEKGRKKEPASFFFLIEVWLIFNLHLDDIIVTLTIHRALLYYLLFGEIINHCIVLRYFDSDLRILKVKYSTLHLTDIVLNVSSPSHSPVLGAFISFKFISLKLLLNFKNFILISIYPYCKWRRWEALKRKGW